MAHCLARASWIGKIARRLMLRVLLAGASLAPILSMAHADDPAVPKLEGLYMCLQNANMTGSVWHPVECRSFPALDDKIADDASQPVVHLDHIQPNISDGANVWWQINFKGVGSATDKTAHWVCSDHGSGFTCVWQTTQNAEDWDEYNQLRVIGMTNIPSVFWVPKSLVEQHATLSPLIRERAANEARYAKAETLAKSEVFPWSFVPSEGGACRLLGPTTPFRFMQAISSKRHHTSVDWDTSMEDNDGSRSVVADNNDPADSLKTDPIVEYRFYVNVDECNAALARLLPQKGIIVSGTDLQHKPAVKWVITDETESDRIACHWPSVATGASPRAFLAILKEQGAAITEVSQNSFSTADKRTSFEISFAYTLKGHSNQINWSDLGNYGCNPTVKDRLKLP